MESHSSDHNLRDSVGAAEKNSIMDLSGKGDKIETGQIKNWRVSFQKDEVKEVDIGKEGGHKSDCNEDTRDAWMSKRTGDTDCGDTHANPPAGGPRALDSPVGEGNLV